jgi:hypothetical protein
VPGAPGAAPGAPGAPPLAHASHQFHLDKIIATFHSIGADIPVISSQKTNGTREKWGVRAGPACPAAADAGMAPGRAIRSG